MGPFRSACELPTLSLAFPLPHILHRRSTSPPLSFVSRSSFVSFVPVTTPHLCFPSLPLRRRDHRVASRRRHPSTLQGARAHHHHPCRTVLCRTVSVRFGHALRVCRYQRWTDRVTGPNVCDWRWRLGDAAASRALSVIRGRKHRRLTLARPDRWAATNYGNIYSCARYRSVRRNIALDQSIRSVESAPLFSMIVRSGKIYACNSWNIGPAW